MTLFLVFQTASLRHLYELAGVEMTRARERESTLEVFKGTSRRFPTLLRAVKHVVPLFEAGRLKSQVKKTQGV